MEGLKTGEVISELQEGASGSVNWHIKKWAEDFDVLMDNVGCVLPIYNGNSPPVKIRFSFVPHECRSRTDVKDFRGNLASYSFSSTKYLRLIAELISGARAPLILDVTVKDVTYATHKPLLKNKLRLTIRKDAEGRNTAVIDDKFFNYRTENYGSDSSYTTLATKVDAPKPKEWILDITAAILQINENVSPDTAAEASGGEDARKEASFTQDVKLIYGAENNFADLRLEMKDNMTLSGHRFILAARSPVLRELMEEQVNKPKFSGVIQMSDVNAKPMIAVLHWMYTGELHENIGRVMEEVVDICGKFEIPELLKILDNKLITICTSDNMFQLFQVAKKNGMKNAETAISAFIKENI